VCVCVRVCVCVDVNTAYRRHASLWKHAYDNDFSITGSQRSHSP
jgi:hypothetical protein